MKPASAELLTLLQVREFYMADLYTFQGGNLGSNILRYTGGDTDIKANGFTYTCGGAIGPYWDRQDNKAKCHWKFGVEVDKLVLDVIPGAATLFGAPFAQALRSGLLDGAEMTLEKVFMPFGSYGDTSRGSIVYFVGRVAPIDGGRSVVTLTINSHAELLNQALPRNLFSPRCVLNLGGPGCNVQLAGGTVTQTLQVSTGSAVLVPPSLLTGTEGVLIGSSASGTGIPGGATVVDVNNTGITISTLGTSNGTVAVAFTNPQSFQTTGTVSSGSTNAVINASIVGTFGNGNFDLGSIAFTSGVLSGLTQTIKQMTYGSPNVIQLLGFFPSAPAPGDSFTITFGCNKLPGVPVTSLCDSANGSNELVNATAPLGVAQGMTCTGPNIPAGTTVINVSGTTIVLSQNATGNNTQVSYSFFSTNGCFKFGNKARYKGMPAIPQPALAI